MSGVALILAGHGSHISASTAGVVWDCVDRLRQLGVADEITACFWKEPPAFSQALNMVEADDVVVVPLFTARGYFAQQALPSEMGLGGPLTRIGKRRIHLTPTIGEHRILDAIVDERLRDAINRFNLAAAESAVAVIGHGTRRNRQSRDTARQQAERLRAANWFDEVVAVYLDDDPPIPSVYQSTRSPNIIALPYFLADGSHVGIDLPRALGISGSATVGRVNGRAVYYCAPVGTDESICDVALALARDTGLPFESQAVDGAWACFPSAGRRLLSKALDAGRILTLGQVNVSRERVWHSDARAGSRKFGSPASLRRHLREQPFRPLPTSVDMPGDWQVECEKTDDAHAVVETVYPGVVADWAANCQGRLTTESLETVARRQQGMFRGIQNLAKAALMETFDRVCGGCIRQPTWREDLAANDAALPCRSACNVWLSAALEMGESL